MAASDCITGHRAFIYDRGGVSRQAAILDINRVQWSRTRDDISTAMIRLRGGSCSRQRAVLAAIEPKRSELVIFRGNERVWEGPVHRTQDEGDVFEVHAQDVLAYPYGTVIKSAYSNAYPNVTEVTTRIGNIIQAELAPWEALSPPANVLPHLVVHHWPNEARTSAATVAYEMTVWEHLDSLARYSGIDYCTVGRSIHIWDTSRPLGQTRVLTEADFEGQVVITAYGSEFAARAYVTDGLGAVGVATGDASYYGPWETLATAYHEETSEDLPTQAELISQAQRNLTGRNPVPVHVRIPDNSSIIFGPGLGIEHMVPGVHMPLMATLNARPISQLQKLRSVTVTEEGGSSERVQVVLYPASAPDMDEV